MIAVTSGNSGAYQENVIEPTLVPWRNVMIHTEEKTSRVTIESQDLELFQKK
jgi:hypothetical protein